MKIMDAAGSKRVARLRILGYALAAVFAAVGGLFLILPRGIVAFFNSLSALLGMAPAPESGVSFFSALAAAYMVMITILAWNLGRRPWDVFSSRLLVQAKLASSLVSLILFLLAAPFLILLANGIVDAFLAALVFFAFRNVPTNEGPSAKRARQPARTSVSMEDVRGRE
jgi:hypothetical protein